MIGEHSDSQVALVVEDEALIALHLESMLIAEGFTCGFATDLAEVEAISLDSVTLAVVDLWLRDGLVGQSVIRTLRERVPHLPIVVVTGFALSSPEADLRGLGGPTDRLEKPVAPSEFSRAVWAVMDRRQLVPPQSPTRRREDDH